MSDASLVSSNRVDAGVAQLVEHFLAKEDVARSSRVTRSSSPRANRRAIRGTELHKNCGGVACFKNDSFDRLDKANYVGESGAVLAKLHEMEGGLRNRISQDYAGMSSILADATGSTILNSAPFLPSEEARS
jgi:hypothetical protein